MAVDGGHADAVPRDEGGLGVGEDVKVHHGEVGGGLSHALDDEGFGSGVFGGVLDFGGVVADGGLEVSEGSVDE